MADDNLIRLRSHFDTLVQILPDDGVEFWFARDLQEPLGYARWENFITAVGRAIVSCKTTGYDPDHHFRGVTKMVRIGSGTSPVSYLVSLFLAP